jgi:hypothetical protein
MNKSHSFKLHESAIELRESEEIKKEELEKTRTISKLIIISIINK